MFDHHCTACDRRQLIFPSMITGMANTDHGIVLAFECWCGAQQTALTGKATEVVSAQRTREPVAA
jgi:hypothetical protein